MCRDEWVGDAVLRMLVCLVLSERYPDEYPVALKGRVDAYVANGILSKFCKSRTLPFCCHGFERYLGRTIQKDFKACKKLVEELIDFGMTEKVEKIFKEQMVRLNITRCSLRPEPCRCGSMNLNIWKNPAKVVCRDCQYRFSPDHPVKNTTETIAAWNHHIQCEALYFETKKSV